jgi:hypothetical protein
MARWIDHHQIIPLKQNGAKYNSNSEQVLKVLAGKWLDEVGAPKTPNFAGNLTGRTLAATIDVWAARHLHRLGHEFAGEKKGWRPQAGAEPGVSDIDFAFSQDAMKHAADKIGINADDLQAILWYAEKHHWDDKGWTGAAGAEKGSFDETWDKAFPPEGKAMSSQELQKFYQDEKKRDDRLDSLKETLTKKRTEGQSEESIEKYLTRFADPFLKEHGLNRQHLEPPAAPGVQHMQEGGPVQPAEGAAQQTAQQFQATGGAPPAAPWGGATETQQNISGPDTAPIRYNNPSGMKPGDSSRKFGATTYGVIADGNRIASFPDAVSGAAGQFDLLNRNYVGMSIGKAIDKWSGHTGGTANVSAYANKVAKSIGASPDDLLTSEMLQSPQGIDLAKAMAKHEAAQDYPMLDSQWQDAQQRAFGQQ